MMKLDRFDLKILDILSRDGRITKSKLAEAINLSVSPCWERVKRLENAGMQSSDIDLFELNEAFASVVLRYQRLMDKWLVSEAGIERYFTYIVTKTVKRVPIGIDTDDII